MIHIEKLRLDGLLLITPSKHADNRGFFSEVYRADAVQTTDGPVNFVQDNHSLSAKRGTVRGLHYQNAPRSQGKLVRVLRGAIMDVAVDARRGSPTFGQHVAVELSQDNWQQLYIPEGFLHGFCTLTDMVEITYKVTDYYSREHDAGIRWNDPDLGIQWPFSGNEAIVSDKDANAPLFRDIFPPA